MDPASLDCQNPYTRHIAYDVRTSSSIEYDHVKTDSSVKNASTMASVDAFH
jgi:hypothetical protein